MPKWLNPFPITEKWQSGTDPVPVLPLSPAPQPLLGEHAGLCPPGTPGPRGKHTVARHARHSGKGVLATARLTVTGINYLGPAIVAIREQSIYCSSFFKYSTGFFYGALNKTASCGVGRRDAGCGMQNMGLWRMWDSGFGLHSLRYTVQDERHKDVKAFWSREGTPAPSSCARHCHGASWPFPASSAAGAV